jgi:membrane protease YdiL (CAAX protease family)
MKRALAWLLPLGSIAAFLSFPFPPPITVVLAELVIAFIVIAGLYARDAIGLNVPMTAKHLLLAIPLGVVAGAIVLAILPLAGLQSRIIREAAIPLWKRCIIAFDSGTLEELVFRLFVMTVVAWAMSHVASRKTAIWAGMIIAALAFGAAHLPRWMALGSRPSLLIAVMVVNGAIAIFLGLVYWKWGIESAIVAHIMADVTAHVVGPYLFV